MENQEQENAVSEVQIISIGSLDWRAVEKPAPVYPALVADAQLSGRVVVQVVIDVAGKVEQAVVISGHPLAYKAVLQAVWRARFAPTMVSGQPVKVSGFLSYDLP